MDTTEHDPMRRRRATLAVAALVLLVMSPNLVWFWFPQSRPVWFSALVLPSLLLAALFAVCGRRLWIACLVLAPFAPLAPLEALYIATYRRPTFPEVIGTLMATNLRETIDYLGAMLVPVVLLAVAALALAVLAVRWSYREGLGWSHRSRHYTLLAMVLAPLLVALLGRTAPARGDHQEEKVLSSVESSVSEGFPFGMAVRLSVYYRHWSAVRGYVASLKDFRFHARRQPGARPGGRQVYVLVIGESSRVDRWQLFGYGLRTTPELVGERNLVAIPDMVASWPLSVAAIPMMLTRKPITSSYLEFWKEGSILRAMGEAGFETWWISNQQPLGEFDSLVAVYAADAQHRIYMNHAGAEGAGSYDDDLLKPLREALASSNRDQFIVLHMMGSHALYDMRYPPAFAKFHPTMSEQAPGVPEFMKMLNSYDNTIAYTDHELAAIIAVLRGNGGVSALWYASDHGENLPSATCSSWGHGLGTRMDLRVPAFVWYSDAYAAAFPERLAALRANAGQPTLSASAFESLVDMAGIELPDHDPSMSLFNPKWSYHKRTINGLYQLDFDHSDTDESSCDLVIPPKKP